MSNVKQRKVIVYKMIKRVILSNIFRFFCKKDEEKTKQTDSYKGRYKDSYKKYKSDVEFRSSIKEHIRYKEMNNINNKDL